jgi:NAD(P)H-hydrate epimerase
VLLLDAPSSVDTTTGTVCNPAVHATATMILALPKEGLRAAGVSEQLGELYLADISVPPELYAEPALGLEVPHFFAEANIVCLTRDWPALHAGNAIGTLQIEAHGLFRAHSTFVIR